MRQVLLVIALRDWLGLDFLPNIPVYGYGMMLFFAFIATNWLAKRLCERERIDGNLMLDLAIWLFVSGILGARTVYVIQYWDTFPSPYYHSLGDNTLIRLISLWDGGLVLYGSIFGGALGYLGYYLRHLRCHAISSWKMLDVVAPCVALGLALGRIGCLFTGCCYGNVACAGYPALHFPLFSNAKSGDRLTPPTGEMIRRGYQTPLGFLLKNDSLDVEAVEPDAAAARAGLQPGDEIVAVNGKAVLAPEQVWYEGGTVKLDVRRAGAAQVRTIEFEPTSIGLNPTQIYETISMCLMLFFLLSYYPFKRHDGEVMVFLMFGYGVHRFLNEMLRTDTEKVAFNLTLSQNISLAVLAGGVVLAYLVWWRRPLLAHPCFSQDSAPPLAVTEEPSAATPGIGSRSDRSRPFS